MAFNKSSKSSTELRVSYKKIRCAKNPIQKVTNIKAFLCIQNTETAVRSLYILRLKSTVGFHLQSHALTLFISNFLMPVKKKKKNLTVNKCTFKT